MHGYCVVVLVGLMFATIIYYIYIPMQDCDYNYKCHIIVVTWALVVCLIYIATPGKLLLPMLQLYNVCIARYEHPTLLEDVNGWSAPQHTVTSAQNLLNIQF